MFRSLADLAQLLAPSQSADRNDDSMVSLAGLVGSRPPAFAPQGNTGGPVNMPGRLASGRPAAARSEGTEYERAIRELASNPPSSLIGSLVNPQQASLVDIIRAELLRRQAETGYGPQR
jgi:hypothetical protein